MDGSMPSSVLNRMQHLPLSDEDLAWLGAITAYWSFGEQQLELLISILARSNLVIGHAFIGKRIIPFDQKIKNAKKLIRLILRNAPHAQEVGIALMTRGKQLSEQRKRIGHWIVQSNQPIRDGISFTDFAHAFSGYELSGIKREVFSVNEIKELTEDIARWSFEVAKFPLLCALNGYLSVPITWHGSRPDGMALKWEDFHTIQKIPRSQTNP